MKKWLGDLPATCNICNKPLATTFFDGKTQMGPWAIMCSSCHKVHGIGLGTGRGQKYDAKTKEKVAG